MRAGLEVSECVMVSQTSSSVSEQIQGKTRCLKVIGGICLASVLGL